MSLALSLKRTHRTLEGQERAAEGAAPPQKRFFRMRAHINPLNASDDYEYPIAPERMSWSTHYPAFASQLATTTIERPLSDSTMVSSSTALATIERHPANFVSVSDIGCGFGGLLVGLGPLFPDKLMIGMEIRGRVSEYVRLRVLALRAGKQKGNEKPPEAIALEQAAKEAGAPSPFAGGATEGAPMGENLSVSKTNAMKLLPHFLHKQQLEKVFFCFPDPHFKKANVRRRIITQGMLAEYAYSLREGGLLYTITDVADLHRWMASNCELHPYFERVSDDELKGDSCVPVMRTYTEEGQKVARLQGSKYIAVFRKVSREKALEKERKRTTTAASGGAADFWHEPELEYEHRRALSRSEYHI
jgi:tRNA (guanine-N7-)-methyltransferase